jgi:hypothetical protein
LSYDFRALSAKKEPLPPTHTAGSGGGRIVNGSVTDRKVHGPF